MIPDTIETKEDTLRRFNKELMSLAKNPVIDSGDLNAALHVLTESISRALNCERCSIWFYKEVKISIQCLDLFILSENSHNSGMELFQKDFPHYFEVLQSQRLIIADDAVNDESTREFAQNYLKPLNIVSMLDAPILMDGKLLGIVCNEQVGDKRAWTLEEQTFVGSLADMIPRIFQAVERKKAQEELKKANERLEQTVKARTRIILNQKEELEHQIKMAKKIQGALLPSVLPKSEYVDLQYLYTPMMELGGDFVDFLYDEENHTLGFFICDVSGHGVSAALLASMVKMSYPNWRSYIQNPEYGLTQIYESLCGKFAGHFITAILGTLNVKTGEGRMTNAGHCPPVLLKNGKKPQVFNRTGALLTDLIALKLETIPFHLDEGDRLVLYTDGIIEAFSESKEMFTEERLLALLDSSENKTLSELCQNVFSEVNRFMGTAHDGFMDDLTILALERRIPFS
ncbi:GAF domain-containing protein [Leptospira kmetyi]|nr:GAF domain-containing protein [Leptospira kmetyi]